MLKHTVIPISIVAVLAALAPVGAWATDGVVSRYDRDTVIVKFRAGVTAAERRPLRERAGVGRTVERVRAVGAEVARVTGDPGAVAARLERSPKVAYAEPDLVVRAAGATPDDPRFDHQWALHNTGQGGGLPDADIDAPAGWRRAGLGGFPPIGGAPVGIVDSGVDAGHPDLQGRVAACHSFYPGDSAETCADDNGHGTHVAGIVGARADNGIGVAGVAFNSPLIVCRALGGGSPARGNASDVAECIDWVDDQGAEVINMSFGGRASETIRHAVRGAWNRGGQDGAVLVAAAGNEGTYAASYPATFPQVISVTATDRRDELASFSNRHKDVELSAPGASILSAALGRGYRLESGTSMAAPHAAGVAAELRHLHPGASATRIRSLLRKSVDDLGADGRDSRFGYGRVNLSKAAQR